MDDGTAWSHTITYYEDRDRLAWRKYAAAKLASFSMVMLQRGENWIPDQRDIDSICSIADAMLAAEKSRFARKDGDKP